MQLMQLLVERLPYVLLSKKTVVFLSWCNFLRVKMHHNYSSPRIASLSSMISLSDMVSLSDLS